MIRVKFNNQASFKDVEFKMLSSTSVQLVGKKLKENTSGFMAYRTSGSFLGDYSAYTKCTKINDTTFNFGMEVKQ